MSRILCGYPDEPCTCGTCGFDNTNMPFLFASSDNPEERDVLLRMTPNQYRALKNKTYEIFMAKVSDRVDTLVDWSPE